MRHCGRKYREEEEFVRRITEQTRKGSGAKDLEGLRKLLYKLFSTEILKRA